MTHDPRAELPQVDAVLREPAAAAATAAAGQTAVTTAVRTVLAEHRAALGPGDRAPSAGEVARDAADRVAADRRGDLRAVVNATGVVLHTGLGRAPLSAAARDAVLAATGYSDVELDLATGERGSRTAHVGGLAARACGAEAATVVNNGAGALVLVLAALAHGAEVIVSRGELVEIGGAYRLPDVMAAAGVQLVEVGTTNRTRIADHRGAVTERTGLLLKVHRSNFDIVGFTEDASLEQLVTLGAETGLPVVHDLGSGQLTTPAAGSPLADEPTATASITAGADLVIFSGDKLLGGPQAGIIAGRPDLVAACRAHPLARALRIDALQRAALEATLQAHLRGPEPTELPVVAMLHADVDGLERRARALAAELEDDGVEVVATEGRVGGGSAPTRPLPSWAVALDGPAQALATALRHGETPVVARTVGDRVLLDLRTVPPSGDGHLADLVRAARELVHSSASAAGASGVGGSGVGGGDAS